MTAAMINANTNAPITFPPDAILIPTASAIGCNVPCHKVSPIPAIGPIKPVLILLIASSSISAPFARSSSIARTIPLIIPPK